MESNNLYWFGYHLRLQKVSLPDCFLYKRSKVKRAFIMASRNKDFFLSDGNMRELHRNIHLFIRHLLHVMLSLYAPWDPIGISTNPGTQHTYSGREREMKKKCTKLCQSLGQKSSPRRVGASEVISKRKWPLSWALESWGAYQLGELRKKHCRLGSGIKKGAQAWDRHGFQEVPFWNQNRLNFLFNSWLLP